MEIGFWWKRIWGLREVTLLKFTATKNLHYPEFGGIENYGYVPKGTVCTTAVVEGCEAILHHGKVVCDVDSGMVEEYFKMEEIKNGSNSI